MRSQSIARADNRFPLPDSMTALTITAVEHYTDDLFRFRVNRPADFRFRSGEFVMIGLPNDHKPLLRAYSIASPSWDDELEFYSIKVQGGALTGQLQNIAIGDTLIIRRKATGTLVNDALLNGQRLFLFSTGTGIAPFASVIRDPETYDKYDEVILCHTCRTEPELQYGFDLIKQIENDPMLSEFTQGKIRHYASTTRQKTNHSGRITNLLESGKLFEDLKIPAIDPATDRAMICGSLGMTKDTAAILERIGLIEGSNSRPNTFVLERAFVD